MLYFCFVWFVTVYCVEFLCCYGYCSLACGDLLATLVCLLT